MTLLMTWVMRVVRERRLRKRFKLSVIYESAAADRNSDLGKHSVLFRNVSLVNSKVGAYSYVQSNTGIFNAEIGPFCSLAGDVIIGLATLPTQMVSTSPVF